VWRVSTFGNGQADRLLLALFSEVLSQALTKTAGMRPNDTVDRRIVVWSTVKERLTDTLLVDLLGSMLQRQLAEVHQQAAEPRRPRERWRAHDALHQLPSRIIFKGGIDIDLGGLLAHASRQAQVHTEAVNFR
jgi:hypothetical protein